MRLRVATLNVWGLPEPFAPDVTQRMHAIGDRLPALDSDLIAFQEVWTRTSRQPLVAAGRRSGMPYAWFNDVSVGGSGLLILSRMPLESVRFDRFAWRGQAEQIARGEYFGGKGFASIGVRTSQGPVTLIDTHLHARYANDAPHEYRPHRTAQLVQLAQHSREIHGPLVMVGDLNFRESDPEYAVLTGLTGATDVAADLDRRQDTVLRSNPYRRNSQKPDRRIDFIFVRDGARCRARPVRVKRIFDDPFEMSSGSAACSNHAGLLAELEISVGPGAARLPPDPEAVALASSLLAEGRGEALRRQSGGRTWAGVGLGCAALASTGARAAAISRRNLLRASLKGAALLALTPGVGLSLMSEMFVSDEIRAFDDVTATLARLELDPGGAVPS